jgi:hypothetical protein
MTYKVETSQVINNKGTECFTYDMNTEILNS